MQHPLVVRGSQPGAQLARDLQRLRRRQAPDPPEQRRQILPVDVLHRQEHAAPNVADVVDTADVGVRDRPRVAHLGEQAVAGRRVAVKARREELERDRLAESQVVGAIHLAHPAAADQRDDAVAIRQDGARRKAAGIEGMRRRGDGARFGVTAVHVTLPQRTRVIGPDDGPGEVVAQ